jgi:hypothetical protein
MDGVKDLIRRPRKETATSRDSDRSLLRKGRAAAVRRIVQRFKPAKAVHANSNQSDPLNGSSIQMFKVLRAFIIGFPALPSHCVSKPTAPCRREPKRRMR